MLRNSFLNAIFFLKSIFLTTKHDSVQKPRETVILQHRPRGDFGGKWEEKMEGDPRVLEEEKSTAAIRPETVLS